METMETRYLAPVTCFSFLGLYSGSKAIGAFHDGDFVGLGFQLAYTAITVGGAYYFGKRMLKGKVNGDLPRKDAHKFLGVATAAFSLLSAGIAYDAFNGNSHIVPREAAIVPLLFSGAFAYVSYYALSGKLALCK